VIIVSEVRIVGFRSIRQIELPGLGNSTALAGLNNCGKSNVLRALNAFFSGETDPGSPLEVDRDFYRFGPKGKAKVIEVELHFKLPESFKLGTRLKDVEAFLGGSDFSIGKRWRREEPFPTYLKDGTEVALQDRQKIDQFLQRINFRYIPNRVLPIDIIRGEHQGLQGVLVRRLSAKTKNAQKTFEVLHDTSAALIKALSKRVRQAVPDLGDLELATPASWAEMAFTFGYRLTQSGVETQDTEQGSGIQSLLMLETLYLIDRDYFQRFGWRQAAIWAVEEPESSLHSSLEARIASFLASMAKDPKSRLQILATTHSDLVMQYSDHAILLKRDGPQTVREEVADRRELLSKVSRAGISRWVHPLLHFPLDPLILVGGKFDWVFLTRAFSLLSPGFRPQVSYLELLSGNSGGVEQTIKYLKAHRDVIGARPDEAPVILVIDWDSKSKEDSAKGAFPKGSPGSAVVWPSEALNPKLGKSFKGVERCYSERLVTLASENGAEIAVKKDGTYVADRDSYGATKQLLSGIVESNLERADLVHAEGFLRGLLKTAAITSLPVQLEAKFE
jgi:hypothetical protein